MLQNELCLECQKIKPNSKKVMKDFIGQDLHIGDYCTYIKTMRTGSSTNRKIMFADHISGFTAQKVIFNDTKNSVFPCDVVCLTAYRENRSMKKVDISKKGY